MKYIWSTIIVLSICFSLITGNVEAINETILTASYQTLLQYGIIASSIILWSGILQVCIDSGFLKWITFLVKPLIKPLFYTKSDEALSYIAANITCNILALGSAATPFGLKAMNALQQENENKNKESKDMATLVLINACGFSLMPSSLISLRLNYSNNYNSLIIFYIILFSFLVTVVIISINKLVQKWA